MFPFSNPLEVDSGFSVDVKTINDVVGPLLTKERRQKIDRVVEGRCQSVAVILEDIYDRGNASAVMRTAEALGFLSIHMIETGEKFKAANRVTQGADKWLHVKKWKSTTECVKNLKGQGFRIFVTDLEASKPIEQIDFSEPSAIVLGNEKEGISKEMRELADERIIIPMPGFVQSFNISVAGAISLYHIYLTRLQKWGQVGDLNSDQQEILRALYTLRTQDSAPDILRDWIKKKASL
ncbi:MAG: TrmH family RNA methyltransferase [Pseudobdellovibrionaceae bacterium]